MADGRSVTLTEVRHVPNLQKNLISIGMLDSKGCSFDASGGTLRVSKGNKEMLWGKKTRGLYRLEGNVQTEGATVRHGSSGIIKKNGQGKQPLHRGTQSKRKGTWRIRSGTRAQGDALGYVRKSGQTRVMQPVQDVHREAQRKETKSILRSCTVKGAATPKRVSFALDLISGGVLSSCAHKGGEMEPRQLAKDLIKLWKNNCGRNLSPRTPTLASIGGATTKAHLGCSPGEPSQSNCARGLDSVEMGMVRTLGFGLGVRWRKNGGGDAVREEMEIAATPVTRKTVLVDTGNYYCEDEIGANVLILSLGGENAISTFLGFTLTFHGQVRDNWREGTTMEKKTKKQSTEGKDAAPPASPLKALMALLKTVNRSLVMSLFTVVPAPSVHGSSWMDWQRTFAPTKVWCNCKSQSHQKKRLGCLSLSAAGAS
ncbi:hypothetical protein Acr_26g0005320 [Actinidia rufa]|uniref:Retrovirus-related Pol polyprotein from transposon TNT 1-94-like beta-barrel domain-containing protein n=1 Tax=Actinidia rufa TaxID=165716 RepID=A0A7J0H2K2_9ERIC|nr:hypothetical protein Acr_26g0005320 [Actinidia rufa]